MNKQDLEALPSEDKNLLKRAKTILAIEVTPKISVPRGYVLDESTGTIYKLDTWLRNVRQGLKDAKDGHLAEEEHMPVPGEAGFCEGCEWWMCLPFGQDCDCQHKQFDGKTCPIDRGGERGGDASEAD